MQPERHVESALMCVSSRETFANLAFRGSSKLQQPKGTQKTERLPKFWKRAEKTGGKYCRKSWAAGVLRAINSSKLRLTSSKQRRKLLWRDWDAKRLRSKHWRASWLMTSSKERRGKYWKTLRLERLQRFKLKIWLQDQFNGQIKKTRIKPVTSVN